MLYYNLKCDECESEEVEILVKLLVPLSKVKLPNKWTIHILEQCLVKCVGPICHARKESSKIQSD